MKKMMAILLAATMAFGLAVPALAETPQPGVPPEEAGAAIDTTNSGAANSGAGSQAVTIAYEVPESFTWTIPDLNYGEVNMQYAPSEMYLPAKYVTIEKCYLAADHCIKLEACDSEFGMCYGYMKGGVGDDQVFGKEFQMWLGEDKATNLDKPLLVSPENGSAEVPFNIMLDITKSPYVVAGDYSADITFRLTVVDKTN